MIRRYAWKMQVITLIYWPPSPPRCSVKTIKHCVKSLIELQILNLKAQGWESRTLSPDVKYQYSFSECPNNELVQMKQPKLAKRPVDYISLRCIIANISSNDLQYYRWYTRDENGATSSICFTSLSDTTDPQSQTCKIDDDSVGFQKEASEYHNMLNNSILTTIGISVELNESYKYICEVTMTNKSRCHLEYGVKYGGGSRYK